MNSSSLGLSNGDANCNSQRRRQLSGHRRTIGDFVSRESTPRVGSRELYDYVTKNMSSSVTAQMKLSPYPPANSSTVTTIDIETIEMENQPPATNEENELVDLLWRCTLQNRLLSKMFVASMPSSMLTKRDEFISESSVTAKFLQDQHKKPKSCSVKFSVDHGSGEAELEILREDESIPQRYRITGDFRYQLISSTTVRFFRLKLGDGIQRPILLTLLKHTDYNRLVDFLKAHSKLQNGYEPKTVEVEV
jgi:hypothetical protein